MIPIVGVFGTGTYVYFNGIVWQEPFILISDGGLQVWESHLATIVYLHIEVLMPIQ